MTNSWWNDPREVPKTALTTFIVITIAFASMAGFWGYVDRGDNRLAWAFGGIAIFFALLLIIYLFRYLCIRGRLGTIEMV